MAVSLFVRRIVTRDLFFYFFPILFIHFSGFAQVPSWQEVGQKPYGSYDGSTTDRVNLDNLNLSLDIPLFSLPQRGRLAMTYSLIYTNAGFMMGEQCLFKSCSYTTVRVGGMDLHVPFDQSIWVSAQNVDTGHSQCIAFCGSTDESYSEEYTLFYTLYDSRGGQHALLYENGTFRTADGSGWVFTPAISSPEIPFNANEPSTYWIGGVAVDAQGNQYTLTPKLRGPGPATLTSFADPGMVDSIEDPDGNIISLSEGYDSFGRSLKTVLTSTLASTSVCPNLGIAGQPAFRASTWTVPGPSGGTESYTFCDTIVNINVGITSSSAQGNSEKGYNNSVALLQSVILPNGTYWGFVYDSAPSGTTTTAYGDLVELILPTGGSISYGWQDGSPCTAGVPTSRTPFVDFRSTFFPRPTGAANFPVIYRAQPRMLVSRIVNPGNGQPSSAWHYGNSSGSTSWGALSAITPPTSAPFGVVVNNPDGTQVVHGFNDFSANGECSLYETETQYGTPVNGNMTLTKTVNTKYQVPSSYYPPRMAAPLPVTTTTVWPNGQSTYSTTTYDTGIATTSQDCYTWQDGSWICNVDQNGIVPLGKVVATSNYDYNSQQRWPLRLSATIYKWQTDASYLAANLLDTPTQVMVTGYNLAGNETGVSQTNYQYDHDRAGYVGLTSSTPLPANGYITPSKTVLGHVITKTQMRGIQSGSDPVTQTFWLATGKIDHTIDPNGNKTSYTYDYTGEFPANVTYPTTGGIAHREWFLFDSNIGKPIWYTDENGSAANDPKHTTRYSYDSYGSLTGKTNPDGGGFTINYNGYLNPLTINTTVINGYSGSWPVSNSITSASNPNQESSVIYDGLGRLSEKIALLGTQNPVFSVTTYDLMDHIYSVTNPYFTTGDPTYGTTVFNSYDVLGRKLHQTNPDNTAQSWSYSGSTTLFTDENQHQWQRTSDALGRLTMVLEPNGVGAAPTMETDYSYDVMDNLETIRHWGGPGCTDCGLYTGITRNFAFDGLNRLTGSFNPETGNITYTYDANSNLVARTSQVVNTSTNATQTIGYCYDALNRLVAKSNVAPPANCTTAAAVPATNLLDSYIYDTSSVAGALNDIGRLTDEKAYNNGVLVGERSPFAYDTMGRVLSEAQCTFANCGGHWYTPSYTYDLAGNIATAAAGLPPSISGLPGGNLQFEYSYDAGNRLLGVTSALAESSNYPSVLYHPTSYGPFRLTSASFGVNMSQGTSTSTLARTYDKRERILSETDTAAVAMKQTSATASTGSISISGQEATPITVTQATSGSAILTASGSDGTSFLCTTIRVRQIVAGQMVMMPVRTCSYVPNWGTLTVTIGGFAATASYGSGTTDAQVAQELTNSFNGTGSPVSAVQNGTSLTVTANASGTVSNYPITIANGGGYTVSDPNSTLVGGLDPVVYYNAGNITVTFINGDLSYPATVNWGQGSTVGNIAANLASAINSAAGSLVQATVNSLHTGVTLTSNGTGPATNYSVLTQVTDTETALDPIRFPGPSFSVVSTNMTGGAEATTNSGNVVYSYSIANGGGYDGVGNLRSVNDSVTGAWDYSYDTLDRLISATPSSGGYLGYHGCWSYDAFGNRTAEDWQPTSCPSNAIPSKLTPTATYNLSNRITWTSANAAGNSFTYDGAGNVLYDGINSYLYDIEGRLCAVRGYLGTMTSYIYGADGARIAKGSINSWSCNVATNGFKTTNSYVVGLGGEQVSELAISGATSTWLHTNVYADGKLVATYHDSDTYFPLTDWLGTKRAEITPDGKFSTYFSLPYGNESSAGGDATDATEHHFTGKERDTESGNDYFSARYYASSMGRFMSPDPLPWIHWQNGNRDAQQNFAAYIANPQNFNMYAYVNNNPLSHTDPTGMNACGTSNDSSCKVTVTITDRSKDANGHYNDQYKGVAHQGDYNATATVSVNGKDTGQTFLVKTTPSDSGWAATMANGTYAGTLTVHGNDLAIRLQPTNDIPTIGPNPSRSDGASIASGILVHRAGVGNFTGVGRDGRPVSAGCGVICTSQYGAFKSATGMNPYAGSPQGHFTVIVNTQENTPQ